MPSIVASMRWKLWAAARLGPSIVRASAVVQAARIRNVIAASFAAGASGGDRFADAGGNCRLQSLAIDRLCDMGLHAGGLAARDILGTDMRGDGDDRHLAFL